MTQIGTDRLINKIPGNPSLYEIQKKMHFAELLIAREEYYQRERK